MAGRPPKPLALKLLQGNPGKRKLNLDEPRAPLGAEMPAYLLAIPAAVAHWQKWAPVMTEMRVLTQADANAFGRLCRLWAEDEARVKLGAPSDPRLIAEIRQHEGQFGMSPSSRVKIKAEKPQEKTKLSEYTSDAKRQA